LIAHVVVVVRVGLFLWLLICRLVSIVVTVSGLFFVVVLLLIVKGERLLVGSLRSQLLHGVRLNDVRRWLPVIVAVGRCRSVPAFGFQLVVVSWFVRAAKYARRLLLFASSLVIGCARYGVDAQR